MKRYKAFDNCNIIEIAIGLALMVTPFLILIANLGR